MEMSVTSKFDDWKDLFQLNPDAKELETIRNDRGHDRAGSKIQKMSDAKWDTINIDLYKLEILVMPIQYSKPEDLLEYIRIHLDDFLDAKKSEFHGYKTEDSEDWKKTGQAPLGSIMQFDIKTPIGIDDDAAVITSKSDKWSWIFSPVTIGLASPGTHPVSGNRQFGIKTGGSSSIVQATFYTRAVDRALLPLAGDLAYEKGHELWVSFIKSVKAFIQANQGDCNIIDPIRHNPAWSAPEVQILL